MHGMLLLGTCRMREGKGAHLSLGVTSSQTGKASSRMGESSSSVLRLRLAANAGGRAAPARGMQWH